MRHGGVGVRVDREDGGAVLTEASWPAVEAAPLPEISDVREQERILDMGRIERFAYLHLGAPRMIAAVGTGVAVSAAFWALIYFFGDDALGLADGAIEAAREGGTRDTSPPAPIVVAASRAGGCAAALGCLFLAWTRAISRKPAEAAAFLLTGGLFFVLGFCGASLMVGIGEWALGALGLL